jgi:hypothetical protein
VHNPFVLRPAWILPTVLALAIAGAGRTSAATLAQLPLAPGPAQPWSPTDRPAPEKLPDDPLDPMLQRIHAYFHSHEVQGVTMDSRYAINPSEAIRMGVVCQLLGYTEIARMRPGIFQPEIMAHGRYLSNRIDSLLSGGPFDGMLGLSLLQGFEQTHDSTMFKAGGVVMNELMGIPTYQCVLNGGLMLAMATADWALLTGDDAARQKTTDILTQLGPYQNPDGSFPHWCFGSEDIHYTGWMAEELVLLQRMTGDDRIEPILSRMCTFIEGRLDAQGVSSYSDCAPDVPCDQYYDSQHSGCGYDYDTRDWTVEPAYGAQLLDHFGASPYLPVMQFLQSLESGGTWSDKYGYIPPPDDPEYPWSIADTSVANTSINFWILGTIQTNRVLRGAPVPEWIAALPVAVERGPAAAITGSARLECSGANPARGLARIRVVLPGPAAVRVTVHDAAGRRVRALVLGERPSGAYEIAWDGHDDDGRACRSGIYFARLDGATGSGALRIVLLP